MLKAETSRFSIDEYAKASRANIRSHSGVWFSAIGFIFGVPPTPSGNSDENQVDLLVVQLVSTRPPPKLTSEGNWVPPVTPELYQIPQVAFAKLKLLKLGLSIFPWLIKYRNDDRYSYSTSQSMNGPPTPAWYDQTVGGVVMDILSESLSDITWPGYIMRDTPTAPVTAPNFYDYFRDKGPAKWAEWAKNKTRVEIQMNFIDWCIAREQRRKP